MDEAMPPDSRCAVVVRLPVPFVTVYEQHYHAAVRMGYALTGDWQTAERITQQAFVAVHAAWDQVGCQDEPAHALKRAVAERALAKPLRAGPPPLGRLAGRVGGRRQAARAALPEAAMAQADDDDAGFWAAVRRLPKRPAQVAALYYLEGRSVQTVAGILGCGVSVAQAHLDAARAALAAELHVPLDNDKGP